MWEDECPPVSANLRQGDLLRGVFPLKPGTLRTSEKGVAGETAEAGLAVVIDDCCNIEQAYTALVAKVGRRTATPGSDTEKGIQAFELIPGMPFSPYEYALEPIDSYITAGKRRYVVKLADRVSFAAENNDGLKWLREMRVARMTVPARVQLRAKVALHFGRGVDEDTAWLEEHGCDALGRPKA